jgi:hypothetical protein
VAADRDAAFKEDKKGARVFRASQTTDSTRTANAAADLATQLVSDKKFQEHLVSASDHAARASRRVRSRFGRFAAFREIALDQQLRSEVLQMAKELKGAWQTVERKRSHRLRNSLLLVAGAGVVGAIVSSRSSRLRNQLHDDRIGQEGDCQTEEKQAERRPKVEESPATPGSS